jgi:hypothetical protein
MRISAFARFATSLAISVAGIVAACHNDVPRPAIPAPLTPEVTRESPKPQPIDPKRQARKKRVSQVANPSDAPAPTDAGVSDVIDLAPVPDATLLIVRDTGQPLR